MQFVVSIKYNKKLGKQHKKSISQFCSELEPLG